MGYFSMGFKKKGILTMLSREKTEDITLMLELECSAEYLRCLLLYHEYYRQVANGVGSETSWTYHLIPDTAWLLDISPTAGIHDWDFTFPYYFTTYAEGMKWYHLCNHRFRDNFEKQIKSGVWFLRTPRRCRKIEYYWILDNTFISHNAFWSNKKLPADWKKHNSYIPDFDQKKYNLNMEIWAAMNGQDNNN
jgi:hypothetical protein